MKDFKKPGRFGGSGGGFPKRDFNRGGFGGGNRGGHGGGRGGFNDRPVEMHSAICAECGKTCEVPFRPNGEKPVYCRDCFNNPHKENAGGGNFERRDSRDSRDSRPERPSFRPEAPRERPANEDNKRQLDMVITKLDKLIGLMEASAKAAAPASKPEKTETLKQIVTAAQKPAKEVKEAPKKKEKKGYPKKK